MATDSILGLFTSPQQYQQALQTEALSQGINMAKLSPLEAGRAMGYAGAAQVGRGLVGALGGEDPQLKMLSLRNQLAQGKDLTSYEGWTKYTQELQQAGDLQGAAAAAQRATDLRSKFEERQADRDAKLEAIRQRGLDELQRARERGDSQERLKEMELAFRAQYANLGGNLNDLKRQMLELQISGEKEKRASAAEATVGRLESLIDSTSNVMTTIENAKGKVSGTTAGLGGRLLGWTESATDLEKTLDTVKANLGFDRLQQMRNESKTGGALGQVAVKELDRLEAARASLDRAQSPKQLKENLDNVYEAYRRWRNTATEALAEKQAARPTGKSFNSVEEANRANLPKGTIITIGGRRAVVE
jgi:hypothetical protein